MHHQSSRRRLLLQRILVYAAMSISIVLLVAVSMFVILGYQFNRSDGRIEQGGLVQFESRPAGATVTIDTADLGTRTASKTTMSAGSHFIKIERTGYQAWQKSISVVPGTVLWLNYVRLIPTQLTPTKVASLKMVASTAVSDDNKWFAIKEDPATPLVRLADVSGSDVKLSDIELPAASYTHPDAGKTQTFTIETWDPDSNYLLIKHVFNDTKTEWLVLDTANPVNTKNVTTLLGVDATKLVFSNQNSHVLYALVAGGLRRIDIGSATLSGPLVANVADFSLFETRLTYATMIDPATKTRAVGYYDEGAAKPYTVKLYSDDGTAPLHAEAGKYFNENYIVIAYGDTATILKGDLPRSDSASVAPLQASKTLAVPGGVRFLSIKTNGRFVVLQQPAAFALYDMELKKFTITPIKGAVDSTKELGWIDNYMPWSDADGTLRLYEFDGANQHAIMPVVPGLSAVLSPDDKYLYGIGKAPDGSFILERVQLIL